MPEPTYRVKRLVWKDGPYLVGFHADTPLGRITVARQASQYWWTYSGASALYPEKDIDAAKLAAEQWYLSRLLEALEPVEERT